MYIRKVLFVNKLALALILCYTVAKTVMLPDQIQNSLSPSQLHAAATVNLTQKNALRSLSREDYQQIIERNPFGSENAPDTDESAFALDSSTRDPSVSEELGLALFGTISGSPAVARAVIKNLATGETDLYRTGQQVSRATIKSIGDDIVTLSYDGKTKTLRLNSARNTAEKNQTLWSKAKSRLKKILPSKQQHINVITRLSSIESLLKKATIEPYVVNDSTQGLKITGLEGIKYIKDLGLKEGDVIRSVNGQHLTSKKKAYQVFMKARTQPVIDLELLRDDEIKTLSFILQ